MVRLVFVCLGNICRSPTAHGIMEALVEQHALGDHIEVDSAGTSSYHIGEPADARARQTAKSRGFPLRSIARQFLRDDYEHFDYVLAMDGANLRDLRALASGDEHLAKLHLFRDFDPQTPRGSDTPDPYYGGPDGFDEVFDLCQAACEGLLEHVKREHRL